MQPVVLFDLDGTLIDTAHDFVQIINMMRAERGLSPLDASAIIPQIALGSANMTKFGFELEEDSEQFEPTLQQFYQNYMNTMGEHAKEFPGISNLIQQFDAKGIKWGVVTNRKLAFIPQILQQFELHDGAHCIVGSDSTPHRKPHPAPLLYAAQQVAATPENCFYVGDYPTDIEAGKAAGMKTIAVSWGYHNGIETLEKEQPDHLVNKAEEIASIIIT